MYVLSAAAGAVETPTGVVEPPARVYHAADAEQHERPSSLPPFALAAGVSRFGMTGQWGVDWDLIVDVSEPWQATLGNWAHTWHPAIEQNQFRTAHGRPFEERQHLLRLRGHGAKRMLFLPYRAGARPEPFTVEHRDGSLVLRIGAELLEIGASGFVRRGAGNQVTLTAFGKADYGADGITLGGGPMELALRADTGTLTLHGFAGERRLRLPPGWRIEPAERIEAARADDGHWRIPYAGGDAAHIRLTRAPIAEN